MGLRIGRTKRQVSIDHLVRALELRTESLEGTVRVLKRFKETESRQLLELRRAARALVASSKAQIRTKTQAVVSAKRLDALARLLPDTKAKETKRVHTPPRPRRSRGDRAPV